MANWWDAAPVVQEKKNWWDAAPVVGANPVQKHPEFDPPVAAGVAPEPSRGVAATSSFVEGLPVVGPYLQSGVENVSAGIGSLLTGRPQAEVRQEMGGMVDESQGAFPGTSTAAGVGGAVAGTVPLVMAAPTAFGAGSGALLGRMGMGALSGGALGGADAGVRSGGDLGETAKGAALGGALGGIGPAAGDLIGKGAGALASRFRGPSAAQSAFGRAAGADSVDDMAGRLAAMGDDAMPMDLGPNLQRQAGALASTPGRSQEIVRGAIGARDAGANQRIMGALDDTLGAAPIPSQIDDAITASQRALGPAYDDALRGARRVNTEPIANNLEAMTTRLRGDAQRAAQRVRDMLNVTGTDQLDPNPATLLQTRHAIDGMMDTIQDTNARRVLTITRQQINNELHRTVPGIRRVDARFEELANQRGALTRGQQALESGRTAPRPVELADEFQRGAIPPDEMIGPSAVPLRMQQGTRAEIERIVGTNANDRVALQRLIKGEGDWNRARLATLFGRDRADRIINVLDRERAFADTSNIVTRNSETAARTAAQKEVAGETGQPGFFRSAFNMRFGDAAADLGDKAVGGMRTTSRGRANEELAQILTSRDPRSVTRTIQLVQDAQRRGDITAQRAREIIQGLSVGGAQRRPLEITVNRPAGVQ